MNINLTLVVQMIVFAALIWFTMKFVWPMITGAMEERSRKIAAGLAAADKGQQDFATARERAESVVTEARGKANEIIDQAHRRANEMVEEARTQASKEAERLVTQAKGQIELASNKAREELRREVARLTVASASRVLGREIDAQAHADILGKLAQEI